MMTMGAETLESEAFFIDAESGSQGTFDTLVQIVGFLDEVIAERPDNLDAILELRTVLMEEIMTIWKRQEQ